MNRTDRIEPTERTDMKNQRKHWLWLALALSAACLTASGAGYAEDAEAAPGIEEDVEDPPAAAEDAMIQPDDSAGQASVDPKDISGLFEDTGKDQVSHSGETLEEAQSGLYGSDGGSTVNIGHLYEVNGVLVRNSDFPSQPQECWAYANNIYAKIWGYNFGGYFNESDNMLRNLPDEELTLTPEHLKAYVSAAPAGAALRVCNEDYLHGNDIGGHSQIIITHDENGFTVFEGGLSLWPHRREAYYTWNGYCFSGWPGRYQYIKYIKWPGAGAWVPGASGSSAQDLGVSRIEQMKPDLEKSVQDLVRYVDDLIQGKRDVSYYVLRSRIRKCCSSLSEAK